MDETRLRVLVAGLALAGALFVLDPLYFPLLLVGPPLTGVLVARRGGQRSTAVGVWLVAGVALLVYDAAVNQEDVGFHVGVLVLTCLTAWAGWAVGGRRTALA